MTEPLDEWIIAAKRRKAQKRLGLVDIRFLVVIIIDVAFGSLEPLVG